jgi:hypothetical protein
MTNPLLERVLDEMETLAHASEERFTLGDPRRVPPGMLVVYGRVMALHYAAEHDGPWTDCTACHVALSEQKAS